MNRKIRIVGLCAALALSALPGMAEIEQPSGRVVLSVTGEIAAGEASEFDLEMLEALPQHTIKTETPWYEGETTFTGPLLASVFDAVDGHGDMIRVRALNDYSAEISVTEIRNYPVILATRVDGKRFSVRDKGPLFVIYPFTEFPELYNEVSFNKSVWQVARIEVE